MSYSNQRRGNPEINTDQFTLKNSKVRFKETLNIHGSFISQWHSGNQHGFNYLYMYSSYVRHLTFCQAIKKCTNTLI